MPDPARTHTLRARGTLLEVETWHDGEANHAQLRVDGTVVDEGRSTGFDDLELCKDTPQHTHVSWKLRDGYAKRCLLVEPGKGELRKRSIPYAPPPGTRAARLHAWGERHPQLYALRHPLGNLAGTAFVLLGVGAFVRMILAPLVPDVNAPDLPDVDLPDVNPPAWLHDLNPFWYLAEAINWLGQALAPLLGWIEPLVSWIPENAVQYVIGFLAAVVVAVREVRRRRRIVDAPAASAPDRSPGPKPTLAFRTGQRLGAAMRAVGPRHRGG